MTGRPSFLAELRRRNVIRMAGLYLVFAWLMTQVASTVLPMYGAPDWMPRSIVTLLAIGFLPALVFAWVFELTPEGLKFDADVPLEASIGPQTARRMDRAIIVILALALGYFGFDKFVLSPRREVAMVAAAQQAGALREASKNASAQRARSIAVLPLANDGGEPGQLFFSDGLTENLITALSQFDGLQVIGRNSSFRFRNSEEDSRTVGAKLGATHLLEGSVRKLGETVRINAQLVDAASGRTLWSQRYDRPYRDLFALQDEVTQAVAAALSAKLLDPAKVAVQSGRPPSGSVDAYTAWLQGAFHFKLNTVEGYRRAIDYFDRAIELDPGYALAYASRADARMDMGGQSDDVNEKQSLYAQAGEDVRRALALAPRLAEAHLIMGQWLGSVEFNLAAAEAEYSRGILLLPDGPQKLTEQAARDGFRGRHEAAVALLQHALRVDPLDARLYRGLGIYLMALGRLEDAEHAFHQAVELLPQSASHHYLLARLEILRGNTAAALREAGAEPYRWAKDHARVLALQAGADRGAADAALQDFIARNAEVGGFQIAEVYAFRGQPTETFAWLQRALMTRDQGVGGLWNSPFLRRYRSDPRFTAFCRQVGLPTPADVDAWHAANAEVQAR